MSQMSEEQMDPDQGQDQEVCPYAKPAPGFDVLHKCELQETKHCARTATNDYKIKSDNQVCPSRIWSNPEIWPKCQFYREASE